MRRMRQPKENYLIEHVDYVNNYLPFSAAWKCICPNALSLPSVPMGNIVIIGIIYHSINKPWTVMLGTSLTSMYRHSQSSLLLFDCWWKTPANSPHYPMGSRFRSLSHKDLFQDNNIINIVVSNVTSMCGTAPLSEYHHRHFLPAN